MLETKDLPSLIRGALSDRTPREIQDEGSLSRHAAVLVPLYRHDHEHRILFTKRTNKVEAHKGQISFPGGRVDKEDRSLLETALREAFEEIGLHREHVKILGRIDDMRTVASNYIVHPYVGLVPYPYAFRINRDEVERIISVPLAFFLNGNSLLPVEYDGSTYQGLAYTYEGDVIWGATARIINNLVEILKEKIGLPAIEA